MEEAGIVQSVWYIEWQNQVSRLQDQVGGVEEAGIVQSV